jgi:dihydroorotate dehydrogenase electron transfer subunit
LLLGPLGLPFRIERNIPKAFLVGGGVGLPPLIWLAEALQQASRETVAFCGARSADLLPLTLAGNTYTEFAQFGVSTVVSTDDGTLGAHGRVPDVFADYLKKWSVSLVNYRQLSVC